MRSLRMLVMGMVLAGGLLGVATAPVAASCPPDGRTLDVPDGMAWNPVTCDIFDPLVADAMRFALAQGIAPATALTLFRAQIALDSTLARIEEEHHDLSAGFQWTWTQDTVTLVARFKGTVPPDVRDILDATGVPVRYVLIDRSWADLEALQAATAAAIGAQNQVTAIDMTRWSVTATVSAAGLTAADRQRIGAFLVEHPDVRIDIIDGPVFTAY